MRVSSHPLVSPLTTLQVFTDQGNICLSHCPSWAPITAVKQHDQSSLEKSLFDHAVMSLLVIRGSQDRNLGQELRLRPWRTWLVSLLSSDSWLVSSDIHLNEFK